MNKIRIITLNSLNKVFVVEKELLHEDIIQEFKAFDWKKNIERIEKALKCKKAAFSGGLELENDAGLLMDISSYDADIFMVELCEIYVVENRQKERIIAIKHLNMKQVLDTIQVFVQKDVATIKGYFEDILQVKKGINLIKVERLLYQKIVGIDFKTALKACLIISVSLVPIRMMQYQLKITLHNIFFSFLYGIAVSCGLWIIYTIYSKIKERSFPDKETQHTRLNSKRFRKHLSFS